MDKIRIHTDTRTGFYNITRELRQLLQQRPWTQGALALFCPHTTCALTVNEGADPDVAEDMARFLGKLIPKDHGFRHAEGNSDAHIKTSLLGPSLFLLVENNELQLGTWQSVYLCEGDGPRQRQVWVQWLSGT